MKSTRYVLPALLALLIGAGGCILPLGPEDLRAAAGRAGKLELKQKIGLSVDGLTLNLLGAVADVPVPLHHLLWADLGVYEIRGTTDGRPLYGCLRSMTLPGWDTILRTREKDSETCLLVKRRGLSIDGMVVMSREGRELVIARVTGRLHALLRDMLARQGLSGAGEAGDASRTENTTAAGRGGRHVAAIR
jgi:hypothetical protein